MVLRWAARDLRRRWLQVGAIALVIAIGTGVYSALGSTATWRRESNDASFDYVAMYDLRVKSTEGVDVAAGEMRAVLATLTDPSVVDVAEERLVLPTQVDASTADEAILVPGRVVGVDVGGGGPLVNRIYVGEGNGRGLTGADAGASVAVLERNFASFYDLPPAGTIRVAGGPILRYVGLGLAPEYFFVTTDDGAFFAEANFAAVFVPLDTAQRLTGREGRVNDLVIRLRDGVDPAAVAGELQRAFDESGTGLGATVMQRDDEDAYRILYDDIEGDQRFWNVFAALILAGAALGAFNLVNRLVESQRREIGIGMALGQSSWQLALRPLLVGVQIAALGVILGILVGVAVIQAIRPVYTSLLPLPVWHTEFQPGVFVRGAVLGLIIPIVATLWPVWRAVRVTPVDAISTTHRTARGGLAPLLRRLPWPVSAFRRMPLGNLLRAPRRTVLTAVGIGAAIATMVALLGMLDSFSATLDRNDRELLRDHPDRLVVSLDRFVTIGGPEIAAMADVDSVGAIEPVVRVGARLLPKPVAGPGPIAAGEVGEATGLPVLLEIVDLSNEVWAPTVERQVESAHGPGIVIAQKAADDLGVTPGEVVVLEHPAVQDGAFSIAQTPVTVTGIHPGPFRFNAYMDRADLGVTGIERVANQLYVLPAPGRTTDDVERALFELDAVASVLPVAAAAQIVEDSLGEFAAVFRVLEVFIFLLALLIAYNATSINADERAKERATLFAFGLPIRTVIGLEAVEGFVTGMLGAAVGVGLGGVVLRWLTENLMATTLPDLGVELAMSSATITTAVLLGTVAVAVAPLLTVRRLHRMDIPGTLRLVE